MAEVMVVGMGLLGTKTADMLKSLGYTYTLYSQPNKDKAKDLHGLRIKPLDIASDKEMLHAAMSDNPKVIINCAAMTDVDLCETNRDKAKLVNSVGAMNVAKAAQSIGARCVQISTDYVFDGETGWYKETDKTMPIQYYGETKLMGERFVKTCLEDGRISFNYTIVRTSALFGMYPPKLNFVTWLMREPDEGRRVKIVNDQFLTPTYADSLAKIIILLFEKGLGGIFHATGAERVSRYEFALLVARAFGLDEGLIDEVTTDKLKQTAKRPKDSSLDCSKIQESLGGQPIPVTAALKHMGGTGL